MRPGQPLSTPHVARPPRRGMEAQHLALAGERDVVAYDLDQSGRDKSHQCHTKWMMNPRAPAPTKAIMSTHHFQQIITHPSLSESTPPGTPPQPTQLG
jgi:hypothetical protein